MNTKTKRMTMIAVMAAIMCVLGPISLPIGPVPISLQTFAVCLSVYILGTIDGTISILIYLLIGLIGLPVFSGYQAGPSKMFGPTGGYLIGFIFMGLICGWFIDHFYSKIYLQVLGMVLGLFVLYLFGTLWLAYSAGMTFRAALAAGVIPFVALDLVKLAAAVLIGRPVRSRVRTAVMA